MTNGCRRQNASGSATPKETDSGVHAVVIKVRRQPVSETLPLIGTISANEIVEIKPEADGTILEIGYEAGQKVEKGGVLVLLDDSKLAAALAESEANFQLSQANHERAKQLLRESLISRQEYDQTAAAFASQQAGLELKRRMLRDTRIVAPFSGTMGARPISPGQVVNRTTTLGTLVDLETVKVEVEIPERYLGQVSLGQKLRFTVAAYPQEEFPGEIFFIAPQVSESLRTANVQARIRNPRHLLRPGMFASLTLTLLIRDSSIVVPEVAVMNNADTALVFVVSGADIATLHPIKIGERLVGSLEVLEGLQEGDDIIVEGHQKVVPGGKVRRSDPEKAAIYQN